MGRRKNRITIEPGDRMEWQTPDDDTGFTVWEHGRYERSSVLTGQPRRAAIDHFDTLEEATREYPNAEVLRCSSRRPMPEMAQTPPAWFDPSNAGEVWHENDY